MINSILFLRKSSKNMEYDKENSVTMDDISTQFTLDILDKGQISRHFLEVIVHESNFEELDVNIKHTFIKDTKCGYKCTLHISILYNKSVLHTSGYTTHVTFGTGDYSRFHISSEIEGELPDVFKLHTNTFSNKVIYHAIIDVNILREIPVRIDITYDKFSFIQASCVLWL